MRTYPIMLDLRDRTVVVVGAGPVGLRKVKSLREARARVKLVAERIDPQADLAGVTVARESYRPQIIEGALLVFACTDDRELNARIAHDARKMGAMVNVADTPDECDFFLPAVVSDGNVVAAIGTGGTAPAVSAWLKARLADSLPEKRGAFAAAIEELRSELKAAIPDGPRRMQIIKGLVNDGTYRAFLAGGSDAVRAELRKLLDG